MNDHYVINLGRQLGSGGKEIGEKLANDLGIAFYDKELINLASEESGLCREFFEKADEKASQTLLGGLFGTRFPFITEGAYPYNSYLSNDSLFKIQSDVIRHLAEKQSCLFVGRCADYILEDIPNHLNVYVYAPDEARLKNCVENLQMDPQTAKKMMRDVDAARNRYHKAYIPGWQSVFDHKDLMIDSSRFGIDGTAKILADIVKNQWG